jgi:hypothetical protein
MSTSSINCTTCVWILNHIKIGLISAALSIRFEIVRSTLQVARSIFLLPYVARSHVAWSIFLRLINFDRSISLGRFSNWQEQTWTLKMIEIILDLFSSLSRMFWISFQLRPIRQNTKAQQNIIFTTQTKYNICEKRSWIEYFKTYQDATIIRENS